MNRTNANRESQAHGRCKNLQCIVINRKKSRVDEQKEKKKNTYIRITLLLYYRIPDFSSPSPQIRRTIDTDANVNIYRIFCVIIVGYIAKFKHCIMKILNCTTNIV